MLRNDEEVPLTPFTAPSGLLTNPTAYLFGLLTPKCVLTYIFHEKFLACVGVPPLLRLISPEDTRADLVAPIPITD